MRLQIVHFLVLLVLSPLLGCREPKAVEVVAAPANVRQQQLPQPKTYTLEESELGSTRHVHRWGNVFFGGQPQPDDLATIKEQGVGLVIDLCGEGEIDWDEPGEVEKLGMQYRRIPFQGPDALTDDVYDETRKLLIDAVGNDAKVLIHCASANRVGAIWLVYRVLDHNVPWSEALAEAKAIGLRTDGYVTRAEEYVGGHRSND